MLSFCWWPAFRCDRSFARAAKIGSMPLTAISRAVSASMNDCQLAFVERQPIDIGKAIAQHDQYETCLASLGIAVVSLPAVPNLPDAVFVEDPAIVLDEIAIMTRMGAESRRGPSRGPARGAGSRSRERWKAARWCGSVPRCWWGDPHAATTRALPSWRASWRRSDVRCGPLK